MPAVNPDLFRRKATWKDLKKAEESMDAFERKATRDNYAAVMAGLSDLAVMTVSRINRPDLVAELSAVRDQWVERATTAPPIRRRMPRAGDRPESREAAPRPGRRSPSPVATSPTPTRSRNGKRGSPARR